MNAAENIISISTALRPFTINFSGTFESLIITARNAVTARYIHTLLPKNSEIINTNVPISFTLGSSSCITDFV